MRGSGSINNLRSSGRRYVSTCKFENASGIKFSGECGGDRALAFTEKREPKFVGR
jgi:hypothetical protein